MSLVGKVVLVTGASRGIGRDIAIEMAKEGAAVIINYKKDKDGAEETKKILEAMGTYACTIRADVSNYTESKNMMEEVLNTFGKIDILINNAGVSRIGLFMDSSEEEWNEIIDTNLKGMFNCAHNVVKSMLEKGNGTIINISSIWGNVGASCEVIYSAAKGGVNSFTRALAKELAPSNIRVNAIAPGVIKTEMNSWMSTEEREALISEIPMMKFGTGEDIGKLAVFLASENSKYITGQIITVDGGFI